jgi:hypothetical protein
VKEHTVKRLIALTVFVALPMLAAPIAARELPEGAAQATGPIPLRVQLVLSRYQGDKKVSSVPYSLSVVANDKDKTSLRMGVDVPVPQGPNSTNYNYRSVGTNIDCSANSVEGGLFRLDIAVSESSIFVTEKEGAGAAVRVTGMPAFRSFTSTFNVLMRDGQTQQHSSATDPVSGEVLRVEVSVAVLK